MGRTVALTSEDCPEDYRRSAGKVCLGCSEHMYGSWDTSANGILVEDSLEEIPIQNTNKELTGNFHSCHVGNVLAV